MRSLTLFVAFVLFVCISAAGQTINSGSTGADGPFSPPDPTQMPVNSTVVGNCSTACTVTVPLREPGPGQSVHSNGNHVFNFTTVNIPANVTVKFVRNAANTPVFILATGNVTINGVIDVSGGNGTSSGGPGGPGGFDGGLGLIAGSPTVFPGAGGGPGGGGGTGTGSGTFANGTLAYGIPEIQPLIGGSGGAGMNVQYSGNSGGGGGGGGAILIASSGTIDLGQGATSSILAKGGNGTAVCGPNCVQAYAAYPGSGGAVRVVATIIRGNRTIGAVGGATPINLLNTVFQGGPGRIRLDSARPLQYSGTTSPTFTKNDNPIFGQAIVIFPSIVPTIRIVSIGGVPLPTQPTINVFSPDLAIPAGTNPVPVVVEAKNVPEGTQFEILASPQLGSGDRVIVTTGVLTGNPGQPKTGTVNVTLPAIGVGIISAVIRTAIVPEPSSTPIP